MKNLIIRRATHDDAIWIFDELGNGAREGHFSESLMSEFQRMALIASVTVNSQISIAKQRKGLVKLEILPAELWVAQLNGEPAGFLLTLLEGTRGTPSSIELHLAGTLSKFRRNGVSLSLIKHQLSRAPKGIPISARCYEVSMVAIYVLLSNGFEFLNFGDPVEMGITL